MGLTLLHFKGRDPVRSALKLLLEALNNGEIEESIMRRPVTAVSCKRFSVREQNSLVRLCNLVAVEVVACQGFMR